MVEKPPSVLPPPTQALLTPYTLDAAQYEVRYEPTYVVKIEKKDVEIPKNGLVAQW